MSAHYTGWEEGGSTGVRERVERAKERNERENKRECV